MFRLKYKNGFTLVEIMITLSILAIIMLFMFQLLNFNTRLVKKEDSKVEYMQNARLAANYIMKRIRENDLRVIQYSVQNGQKQFKSGTNVIFDATKSDPTSNLPYLWYSFEPDKFGDGYDYGELKSGSSVLASYITDINIIDMSLQDPAKKYLVLTVTAGKYDDDNSEITLCIPYKSSSATPPPSADMILNFPFDNTGDTSGDGNNGNNGNGNNGNNGNGNNGNNGNGNNGNNGNIIYDISGNNNNGIIKGGTAAWVTGRDGTPGGAIHLDGDTYIEVPDSPSLDSISSQMTIDLWCKPDVSGSTMVLVEKSKSSGNKGGFELHINRNNTVTFSVEKTDLTSAVKVLTNGWNHVIASYDANGNIKLTVSNANTPPDGTTVSAAANSGTIDSNNNPLRVGADRLNHPHDLFVGALDDVKIFSRVTQ